MENRINNIDEDTTKLANDLITDFFLSDIPSDLVVNCYKVIIEIIKIMIDDELRAKQTAEPNIKDICLDVEIKEDTFLAFKIKNSNIINVNDDNNEIINALMFLSKYKMDYYQICNSKGERRKEKVFQGFISMVSIVKDKEESYINFLISYYHLNKLLKLAECGYNNLLAIIINSKCEPLANQTKETESLTVKYLNETFGIYETVAKDMCKKLFGLNIMYCLSVYPKTKNQMKVLTYLFKEMNIDFGYKPL
ncbi:hypothetical protein [Capnocytophaga leadbetteri]|uniref:hypothetical protein n=1 Tax=Capnocytophaga leadbetteri TaxID=327575 RepID=UPI0026F03EFD|nr:hypothetical protein [Capnocytophaga leadbetteri]